MTARVYRDMRGWDEPVPYGQRPRYTQGMWFVHCTEHGHIGQGIGAWHHNTVTAEAAAKRHNDAEHPIPREWVGYPEGDTYGVLPPDLTPMDEGPFCEAQHHDGPICTRRAGHTGRHAASNGELIIAVWS